MLNSLRTVANPMVWAGSPVIPSGELAASLLEGLPVISKRKRPAGAMSIIFCGKTVDNRARAFKIKHGKLGPSATCFPHLIESSILVIWVYVNAYRYPPKTPAAEAYLSPP